MKDMSNRKTKDVEGEVDDIECNRLKNLNRKKKIDVELT